MTQDQQHSNAVLGKRKTAKESEEVPGLQVYEDFLTRSEEQLLLKFVDGGESGPWNTSLARRTKHFGARYDYSSRGLKSAGSDSKVAEMPMECGFITKRLMDLGIFERPAEQLIVNEYLPGQGISKHVDSPSDFGPVVVSVSLGSDCVLELRAAPPKGKRKRRKGDTATGPAEAEPVASPAPQPRGVDVTMRRRSAVVLTGASRYDFTHCIPSRKSDPQYPSLITPLGSVGLLSGPRQPRTRRISFTFRTVASRGQK